MGRLALVTGYPGWLTEHLLHALDDDRLGDVAGAAGAGDLSAVRWRALVAPGAAPATPAAGIEDVVEGDIRDPDAVRGAMDGVDLVLHAAGIIHPRRIRELYEINRDGCRNIARAAVDAGVRRLVFVSSNAAAGFATPGRPMSEDDEPRPLSHYGRSKLAGEQALWEVLEGSSTEGVVLRPTTFYGPGFPRRQLRAYRMARSGRPLVIGSGRNRVSMIYIDDLVDALRRALWVPGAAAHTCFVADAASYEWQEVFAAMAGAQGVSTRPRRLPGVVASLCGATDRVLSGLGRYSMMVHVAGEATRHMDCRIDRAREVLGFEPTVGLYEGVRRAVTWARDEGWL